PSARRRNQPGATAGKTPCMWPTLRAFLPTRAGCILQSPVELERVRTRSEMLSGLAEQRCLARRGYLQTLEGKRAPGPRSSAGDFTAFLALLDAANARAQPPN